MARSYRFGEVVYILFPFTDHSGAKDRPAVVISCPRFNREKPEIVLLPITSKLKHGDTYGTVTIEEWERAGLATPSVIKPFPHTALQSDIRRTVGELTKADKDRLREMLSELFSTIL
jgi:mRNA interferase MazF